MKRILLFTLSVILPFGCKQRELTYDEAFEEAANSPRTETKLFLGYQIGMSRDEANEHTRQLIKEGKLSMADSVLTYRYETENRSETEVHLILNCPWDTLVGVIYLPPIDEKQDHNSIAADMMLYFTMSSRAEGFTQYKHIGFMGDSIYSYIKNNLVVTFHPNCDLFYFEYKDAPYNKKWEDRVDKKACGKGDSTRMEF